VANGNNPKHNGADGKKWRADRITVRWSQADADAVLAFIDLLTDAGCAVIFNRTTDGGSLILGLYAGADRPKDYLQTPGDISAYMEWLTTNYV